MVQVNIILTQLYVKKDFNVELETWFYIIVRYIDRQESIYNTSNLYIGNNKKDVFIGIRMNRSVYWKINWLCGYQIV